ncbi:MAG: low specificity L-threonine aldolase [Micrococcales bacterium]|nr:low specificity L-threonine aldolase [Micrococcales bacterium]NBR61327.1 low specificity L-threonine aldolase [Actinomycetota bacterium]NBY43365.1 low specificity L-threonine aldolase [Micrococcales bacterium]NDE89070.1 low specificity L-threonine aldolase [Micrococcales bacterium]
MSLEDRRVWRGFASDNYAGVHPRLFELMQQVNEGHEVAYGDDFVTAELSKMFKSHFGSKAEVFPVFNGTGSNVIALSSVVKRWEAVICAETAHINADEGGAPEKMAGIKLWTIPTTDGKLTPELIEPYLFDIGSVHRAQIAAISITQTTELGTLYSAAEVKALADFAHKNNLMLHMDGARLSNAAAALDLPFSGFTTDVGVDLVSFGGTKIGALAAEAVVVLSDAAIAKSIPFLRKTSMQLPSKMRFVSAQLIGLLQDNLAINNGKHANAMAKLLDEGVREIAANSNGRVSIPNLTQANAVFPILPMDLIEKLQQKYRFYVWDYRTGQVRWMCAWDTKEEDVQGLLSALREALN